MRTKKGTFKRFCKRCGNIYECQHRYSKVCKECRLPMGWEVKKARYDAHKKEGENKNESGNSYAKVSTERR